MKNKLKRLVCLLISLSIVAVSGLSVNASDDVVKEKTLLYVAADGDDSNPGTIDAPFATIEKARDTIRGLKADNALAKDGACVYLRGGTYNILQGIEFGKEDSGTYDAPITYRSYPGEEVNLVGGITIDYSQFKPVTDSSVLSRLSDQSVKNKLVYINLFDLGLKEIPEPEWVGYYTYQYDMPSILGKEKPEAIASELVVNGNAQTVARYPNGSDVLTISGVKSQGSIVRNWWYDKEGTEGYVEEEDRIPAPIVFSVNDSRIKNWTKAENALVWGTFVYSWADQSLPIESIDTNELMITTKYPSVYGVAKDQQVYFYNMLEEIDVPGEYYIDVKSGNLYYYPVDETIDDIRLTTLEDNMFTLDKAEYISIAGLNMSYTRSGMVKATDCKGCEVLNCDISLSGRQAVTVQGDSYDCRVANCYIHNVNGGVYMRGGEQETLTSGNNIVENCEFESCDRLQKASNGALQIWGCGTIVRYNKMHESEQQIVYLNGNNHEFSFNEVYNAVTNTDDMGALYAGRVLTNRGNKITYNYFHDIGGEERGIVGVQAVFLDDFWSWAHISGNVFEKIKGSAIKLAGSHNAVVNNIFIDIDTSAAELNRSYDYGMTTTDLEFRAQLENSPYIYDDVWVKSYPEIVNVIDSDGKLDINNNITAKNNVLYNTPDIKTSTEIAATATLENNIKFAKDPGFADIKAKNYTLNKDAEVYDEIPDFKPIPFTRMGMYKERAMHRVRSSAVFTYDSPYSIINGSLICNEAQSKTIDGKIYIPVRLANDYLGGEIKYDEATDVITMSTPTKVLSFDNNSPNAVTLNGGRTELADGVKNINDTNYISLEDLAGCFEKTLLNFDEVFIITESEADENNVPFIDEEYEPELIRYYGDMLNAF